jgi:hypothetical protein
MMSKLYSWGHKLLQKLLQIRTEISMSCLDRGGKGDLKWVRSLVLICIKAI